MRTILVMLAGIGIATAPAVAQAPAATQPAPAAKQKTVKKTVCKRVESEQVSGSRLGSTTKVCREVEVPAKDQNAQQASPSAQAGGQ